MPKEQTKKHRPFTFYPFVGVTPLNRLTCHFGVLIGVPDLITHAIFYLNRLRGFSAAVPRKWPFSNTFTNDPYNSTALTCRV